MLQLSWNLTLTFTAMLRVEKLSCFYKHLVKPKLYFINLILGKMLQNYLALILYSIFPFTISQKNVALKNSREKSKDIQELVAGVCHPTNF